MDKNLFQYMEKTEPKKTDHIWLRICISIIISLITPFFYIFCFKRCEGELGVFGRFEQLEEEVKRIKKEIGIPPLLVWFVKESPLDLITIT
jgi:hypothetical protein